MNNQTIVSLATPFGYSSIAVIRLSGELSFLLALSLSKTKGKRNHMETALLPIYSKDKKKIDTAIYTFYKAPSSYTGEDVVEISCHGNPTLVDMVISRLIDLGAHLAEPGEYTKRAFLNGKMSLSQAESVALLISSRSKRAIYSNTKNIGGEISKKITNIKMKLVEALSFLEYELDVSENENLTLSLLGVVKTIKNSTLQLTSLQDSYATGVAYNKGFRVVIIGRPNVGKSTLMNALLGTNRSIISQNPGTTRDTITQNLILGGCPITLVDTAGFRNTNNEIEEEGVRRSLLEIEKANLVLSVYCKNIKPVEKIRLRSSILVYNKKDLHNKGVVKKGAIPVSALKKQGIKNLLNKIQSSLFDSNHHGGDLLINTKRQFQAIKSSLGHSTTALEFLGKKTTPIELIAHETKQAINSLDVFLGNTTTEDILDQVFSNFCVGK